MTYALLLFVVTIALVLLFHFPKLVLYSLFIALYILPYPIEVLHVLPIKVANYFDEVFTFLFLFYLIFISIKRKYIVLPLIKYVALFFFISFISIIANASPFIPGFKFLSSFLKPIVFLYFILNVKLPDKFYLNLFYLIMVIAFIQVFFNIGWFLGINPLPNPLNYPDPDFAIGTFGHKASREVANYFCLLFISLLIYNKFYHRKKSNVLLMILLLVALSLSASKISFVMLFLSNIIILPMMLNVKVFRYIFLGAVFLIFGVFTLKKVNPLIFDRYMTYASIGIRANPKIIAYKDILFEVKNDIPFPLFGAGPGMYASTVAVADRTPLALKYVINPNFYERDINIAGLRFRQTGIGFIRLTGFTALAGDIGIIGLIVYLIIYFKVFSFVYSLGKKTKDKCWKTICFSTAGGLIYIILYNSFYDLFSVAVIFCHFGFLLVLYINISGKSSIMTLNNCDIYSFKK